MSLDIILTITALVVATVTSIVGIWVERDPNRATRMAYSLSILIILAGGVSMVQSYMDEVDKQQTEADMARMLVMLDQLVAKGGGGSAELQSLVKSELNAQSRANPDIIKKMAQRISDDGGDPSSTLGSYLPKSEVEALNRSGALKVKDSATNVRQASSRKLAPAKPLVKREAKPKPVAPVIEVNEAPKEDESKATAEAAAKAAAAKAAVDKKAAEAKAAAEATASAAAQKARAAKQKADAAKQRAIAAQRAASAKAAAAKRKADEAKRKADAAKKAVAAQKAEAKRKADAARNKAAEQRRKAAEQKKRAKKKADKAKKKLKSFGF